MTVRPNTFLVGHPRSGSEFVDKFLQAHPDVFVAKKELHFFGSDLNYCRPPRTLDNYLDHFAQYGGESLCYEASVWYLFSQLAAQEIHAFDPHARIIAIVRDPIGWLHSLHAHHVMTLDEHLPVFAEAWADADRRRAGQMPPNTAPDRGLIYPDVVDYTAQVGRYFDLFGRERVHVLLLDDVKADASSAMDGLLDFLDLPRAFEGRDEALVPGTKRRNANKTVYSAPLQRWLRAPPRRTVLNGLRPAPVMGWGLFLRTLRRLNVQYVDRAPMEAHTRAEMADALRPEVERFSELMGRDLGHWVARD